MGVVSRLQMTREARKESMAKVNGAGVEGFDDGRVISPSFINAPNKAEPGEPRVKGGWVGGRVKGVSNEAAALRAATGNGLATPDLEAKLDKSGKIPGRDNVDAFSLFVRLTAVLVDVLGAVGVAIAGGADLHERGSVVDSRGSTSPTSGVFTSGELPTRRLVLLTRGVKLNGEPARGDGFETGAGGEGSPLLTVGHVLFAKHWQTMVTAMATKIPKFREVPPSAS